MHEIRAKNLDAARTDLEQCLREGLVVLESYPGGNATVADHLKKAYALLLLLLLQQGDHQGAASLADGLARLYPDDQPEGPLLAAQALARCLPLVSDDPAYGGDYALRCVEWLRQAMKRGWADPAALDDPAFEKLKGLPEFEQLREQLRHRSTDQHQADGTPVPAAAPISRP